MSTRSAQHAALAQRFHMDIFQQGKLEVADEILASDFTWHAHSPQIPADLPRGPEGVKQVARAYRAAFPDMKITHEDVIASDNDVVIRWNVSGTQRGELLGAPSSGKHAEMTGIDIFRIENGKLAELWQNEDDLSLLQQLDIIPTEEEAQGYPG